MTLVAPAAGHFDELEAVTRLGVRLGEASAQSVDDVERLFEQLREQGDGYRFDRDEQHRFECPHDGVAHRLRLPRIAPRCSAAQIRHCAPFVMFRVVMFRVVMFRAPQPS